MKILVIGKEGRLQKNSDPLDYGRHEFVYVPNGASDEEKIAAGKDADIIIVDAMAKVSEGVIKGIPGLKMIHSEGVGFQGVDVAAAKAAGIPVCNCKSMNATAVAEEAILLMLAQLRFLVTGDKAVREGRQIAAKEGHMLKGDLKELADCTVGFIGFGDIGRATAKMANVFGASCIYYDPFRVSPEIEEEYDVTYCEMDELLAKADIVSLHVPVIPSTINMANEAFFAKMKEGSYLINTARGELVDSTALLTALKSGKLAGAGLDCVAGEPIGLDNPVLQGDPETMDKIIFAPHVGGITASSFKRGYKMIWENIRNIENGKTPVRIVNR